MDMLSARFHKSQGTIPLADTEKEMWNVQERGLGWDVHLDAISMQ